MTKSSYLLIGKIVGPHGVKGYLKMISYAESISIFTPGSSLLLKDCEKKQSTFTVKWAKPHKRNVLLCLESIETRDQAESLTGSELYINSELLPELDEDTYYWSDLIGLAVRTTEDIYLGLITSIIPTGSNDVYVVKDGQKETLVPALKSVVVDIDLIDKTMKVDYSEQYQ